MSLQEGTTLVEQVVVRPAVTMLARELLSVDVHHLERRQQQLADIREVEVERRHADTRLARDRAQG